MPGEIMSHKEERKERNRCLKGIRQIKRAAKRMELSLEKFYVKSGLSDLGVITRSIANLRKVEQTRRTTLEDGTLFRAPRLVEQFADAILDAKRRVRVDRPPPRDHGISRPLLQALSQ